MSHLLREFFRFILSVFGHWQTWLSGSGIGGFIVIAVGLAEKVFGAGLSKKQYVYLFVVSFFLCSCFLAWVDSDDALRTEHEARQTEHSGDLAQLQNAKDQYGELNGKCQYQAGVTDTLRKQNGDQQNSINNCQNQALKLLSPEPTKVEFLQLEKDRAAGESFESTFIIITNRSLSPITLTFACTKDFTGMNIWPFHQRVQCL